MLKKPQSRFLLMSFSVLSVLILLLSACGAPSTSNNGNGSSGGGTVTKGGTWTDDLYEEPDSLIPNASSETFSDMVDQAIYAPLFYGDAQGQIHPGLVTEMPTTANGGISADLKTWTFHLRPGLKWSDGQPEDARDVDFSWRLWTDGKFPAASTIGFNLITGADISSDNLSITFHLKQAFSPFVSIWTDGLTSPLPAHHYSGENPASIQTTPDNLNPSVTSGPFKMSESKPGDHYTVVKNPNYYQAAQGYPYLNSIVFRIVTDQNTILKDLQAGTITSSWFLDVTKVVAYQALSNYKLTNNPNSSNFEAMYFDFHNPILGTDVNVRKAMAMAIDHQALIVTARRGEAVPLCTDHGKSYNPGYEPNAPCPPFDQKAAGNLLTQDGWVMGSDGYRHKGGKTLEFKYSTTANNYWRADDELIIQQDFQAIGIKIDIQNYPASTFFGTFLTDGRPGVYDIAEFEDSFTYDADDSGLFACNQFPPAGFNIDFYCNHQLDQLFVQEQSTADPSQRQAIFNQIHQIYLTEFPFITLYSPTDIAMHKLTAQNYNPGPMGAQEDNQVWTWWCTNAQC
ncbi:MAG TPA: peptide ABC transporter substrate-binding protein [Ktedonobacteraceae bacterium]|nr:peptide ABC transporter substrate-binding protein [Ktedonosporobacter sp.]HZU67084.1 peptide ABC transporter substrate-binding protein [Ktedonobacteraceae bacterium]